MIILALFDNSIQRAQFPAVDNLLYLDAAHQTPLSAPVKTQLDAFYAASFNYAGPKSGWLDRVEDVRTQLAGFFGAQSHEIAFTKNTSEGLNICANGLGWEVGDNVLILEDEHPNNTYAWLAKRADGLEVRFVPNDKKWADAETFAPYIDERTQTISISHVMFHNGQRNDIEDIIEFGKQHGIGVVVDAMQSVGVIPLDFAALGASAIVSGSHKGLLTPHGLGFLYTAESPEKFAPTYVATAGVANSRPDLIAGPEPVELRPNAHRFEIGNLNLSAIHALGGALDLLEEVGVNKVESHLSTLGDQLIAGADELGVELVGPRELEHRSPHIYVLSLKGDKWAAFFASRNVRVSPVRDGIRVSFGLYSTADDVTRFIALVREGLHDRERRGVDRLPV